MLRPLFAILIGAAMLFAPLAMQRAMAATPADHQEMKTVDHCDGEPAQDQGKSAEMPCCAAMCMAVAVEPATASKPLVFGRAVQRPDLARSPLSYLAKLPTPPPRLA